MRNNIIIPILLLALGLCNCAYASVSGTGGMSPSISHQPEVAVPSGNRAGTGSAVVTARKIVKVTPRRK